MGSPTMGLIHGDESAKTGAFNPAKMTVPEMNQMVEADPDIEIEGWSGMKAVEKREALASAVAAKAKAAAKAVKTKAKPKTGKTLAGKPGAAKKAAAKEVSVEKANGAGENKGKTALPAMIVDQGEVLDPDPISAVEHTMLTITEIEAAPLARTLYAQGQFGHFKLGAILATMEDNGWTGGYENLRQFAEQEVGVGWRVATYFIGIYRTLVEQKVKWEDVKDIGWTKLVVLQPIITAGNAKKWAKKAASNNTATLKHLVEKEKDRVAALPGASESEETPDTVKSLVFKAHPDQEANIKAALKKAMEQSGTDVKTVALDYICLDYMGTPVAATPKMDVDVTVETLTALFKGMAEADMQAALETVFGAVDAAFPDVEVKVRIPKANK